MALPKARRSHQFLRCPHGHERRWSQVPDEGGPRTSPRRAQQQSWARRPRPSAAYGSPGRCQPKGARPRHRALRLEPLRPCYGRSCGILNHHAPARPLDPQRWPTPPTATGPTDRLSGIPGGLWAPIGKSAVKQRRSSFRILRAQRSLGIQHRHSAGPTGSVRRRSVSAPSSLCSAWRGPARNHRRILLVRRRPWQLGIRHKPFRDDVQATEE
jgi:hypothetical protein